MLNSDLDKKIATLATTVKLQAFDSIYFCSRSHFEDESIEANL